jgi:hypothetical protein
MATTKKAARKKAAPKKAPASKNEAGAFMAALDHPLKADIEIVRKLILGVSPAISDGVKWNSLSFRKSDWFATVNLRSKDVIQLVLHTGAKAKDNPELRIPDSNGLLLWLAKDRALATLGSGKTLKTNAKAFVAIVKVWLKYV